MLTTSSLSTNVLSAFLFLKTGAQKTESFSGSEVKPKTPFRKNRSAEDRVLCRGSGCPRKIPFSFFSRRRRRQERRYSHEYYATRHIATTRTATTGRSNSPDPGHHHRSSQGMVQRISESQ